MTTIRQGLQANFKEVATESFKLTLILDGHKIDTILNTSEARQFIELIDNKL